MTTKIITCTCIHDYQDRLYGLGRRVHNATKTGYRCTVCRHAVVATRTEKKEEALTEKKGK